MYVPWWTPVHRDTWISRSRCDHEALAIFILFVLFLRVQQGRWCGECMHHTHPRLECQLPVTGHPWRRLQDQQAGDFKQDMQAPAHSPVQRPTCVHSWCWIADAQPEDGEWVNAEWDAGACLLA